MYMRPIPPKIGQVQCTITRHKNGMNRFWPKYTLSLSSTNQFLLTGKKRAGNKTSNYMISMDQEKIGKGGSGFLGKVRSNFLGTEFSLYDHGKNPDDAKTSEEVREQHGVIQYETNVLGSKGPRRMKVLLPMVDFHGTQTTWKSPDVSLTTTFYLESNIFSLLYDSKTKHSRNSLRLITQNGSCSSLTSRLSGMNKFKPSCSISMAEWIKPALKTFN